MFEYKTGTAKLVLDYVNTTNNNIFLTGKAGTGKTTLLRHLVQHTHKNAAITAPTGIAAINAGGVTLHSLLQLPFGLFLPDYHPQNIPGGYEHAVNTPSSVFKNLKMGVSKRNMIRELDLLIIDEVSMLRADLTDCIDALLRAIRRRKNEPFGGLQVLFIGDLLQLPPVVKHHETELFQRYYDSSFFFSSKVISSNPPLYIELKQVYRQQDERFVNLLNRFRTGVPQKEDIDLLNAHYQPELNHQKHQDHIFITTHNHKADEINQAALARLTTRPVTLTAEIKGDFPENMYPVPYSVTLKKDCKVMFIKNDHSGK